MAKGQYLSNYQRGIVNRYYQHVDTIALTKLQEAVSDLFIRSAGAGGPGGDKAAAKIWKSVEIALAKMPADAARVAKIVGARDVKGLGVLVNELATGKTGPAEPARKKVVGDPDAL